MKATTLFFTLLFSVSSFASTENIKTMLEQTEVTNLSDKLADKGFSLSKVVDRYAQSGVRPRCICESFELTFSTYKDGAAKNEVYSVGITGFGNNQKVTVKKNK